MSAKNDDAARMEDFERRLRHVGERIAPRARDARRDEAAAARVAVVAPVRVRVIAAPVPRAGRRSLAAWLLTGLGSSAKRTGVGTLSSHSVASAVSLVSRAYPRPESSRAPYGA